MQSWLAGFSITRLAPLRSSTRFSRKQGKNERSNIISPFSTRSGKNQRKLMMSL
jgi:hypothetical protein